MEREFPDWEQRMDYQKKQEQFYISAMRKQREMRNLRIKQILAVYTKEELDALSYFQGTGFYFKHRDPKLFKKFLYLKLQYFYFIVLILNKINIVSNPIINIRNLKER